MAAPSGGCGRVKPSVQIETLITGRRAIRARLRDTSHGARRAVGQDSLWRYEDAYDADVTVIDPQGHGRLVGLFGVTGQEMTDDLRYMAR